MPFLDRPGVALDCLSRKSLKMESFCIEIYINPYLGLSMYCTVLKLICAVPMVQLNCLHAPSSNHSNNIYRDFIDLLQAVISMYSENGTVIIMGDFNAHLQGQTFIKATDERGRYLLDMLSYHNLVAVDTLPICTGATASFVSYGDAHVSLIDHILVPDVKLDTILSCEISDDHVLNVSRHRPVICVISVSGNNSESSNLCTFSY